MKNFGFIYIIRNTINNKVYIGKTLDSIENRFSEHKKNCSKEKCKERPLYRAMNKYGIDSFYIEQLEQCEIELLSEKEQYYINKYGSFHKGYNATLGGDGKILYDYQKIVNEFLNGKLIKDLAIEFECCEDTISQAIKTAGLNSVQNSNQKKSRKVIAINPKTKEKIQSFESLSAGAQWLIDNQITSAQLKHIVCSISRAVDGVRKTAYGYEWKEDTMNYVRNKAFE